MLIIQMPSLLLARKRCSFCGWWDKGADKMICSSDLLPSPPPQKSTTFFHHQQKPHLFPGKKKQACRCFTVINKNCFMHLKPNIKIGLYQNIFCFPSFFYAAFQINKSDSFPSKIIFCKTFPLYFFKGFFLCEWKYKSTKHTSTTSMVKNRIKNV